MEIAGSLLGLLVATDFYINSRRYKGVVENETQYNSAHNLDGEEEIVEPFMRGFPELLRK